MYKRKLVLFASLVLFAYPGVGAIASPTPRASPPSSSHDTNNKVLSETPLEIKANFTQSIVGLQIFVKELVTGHGESELTFEWDFGDGSTGVGDSMGHKYAAPGVYNIKLTACTVATDSVSSVCGESVNKVTVAELPDSSIDLGGPYGGEIGEKIKFEADTINPLTIKPNYYWEFGDGAKAKGRKVRHSYDAVGSYAVTLTVESAFNDVLATGTTTATIVLNDLPPVVVGTGDREGRAGEAISFDATGTNDPNGGALRFEWDFGDGTPIVYKAKTTHVYSNPGAFNASLVVLEADNSLHGFIFTVTITDPAVIDDHGDNFDVATLKKTLILFGGIGKGWESTGYVFGDIEIPGDKDVFKTTFTSPKVLQISASPGISIKVFKRELMTDCTASARPPALDLEENAPVCAYHPKTNVWVLYTNGVSACHDLAVEKHFPSDVRGVVTGADCSNEVINDEPLKEARHGDLLVPGDYYTVVEGIDDFLGVYQFELTVGAP